jgi:hypothetical protein
MRDEKSDKSLMKYPSYTEAYELRFLEDDFDYHPETSFDPLDINKRFIDYNIDCLVKL